MLIVNISLQVCGCGEQYSEEACKAFSKPSQRYSLPILVQGKDSQCQAKPAHLIWTYPPVTLADGDNLGTRGWRRNTEARSTGTVVQFYAVRYCAHVPNSSVCVENLVFSGFQLSSSNYPPSLVHIMSQTKEICRNLEKLIQKIFLPQNRSRMKHCTTHPKIECFNWNHRGTTNYLSN